jgi:hypothetical protein
MKPATMVTMTEIRMQMMTTSTLTPNEIFNDPSTFLVVGSSARSSQPDHQVTYVRSC